MKATKQPVTMSDLAARLRLSTMSVSRALRNAAGVSARTRKRVVDLAQQLNYRPDPALSVLNKYRHGLREVEISERIAFVTNFPTANSWRNVVTFVRFFDGVSRRARQLGYEIEPFWLGSPGLSPQRASNILHGRGIRGIVVGPLMQGNSTLQLNWDLFSTVALGRSLETPKLSTVSPNHYQAVELACREVCRRGYTRIGFVVTMGDEARTAGAPRAAFCMQQERFSGPAIPPLVVPQFSAEAVVAWVLKHRPEVVLSSEQTHYELLRGALGRKADAIPFVHLNIDPASEMCGIDQGHDVVGEQAAALLHLKLLQRETGVPSHRDILFVDCAWVEGKGRWSLPRPRTP